MICTRAPRLSGRKSDIIFQGLNPLPRSPTIPTMSYTSPVHLPEFDQDPLDELDPFAFVEHPTRRAWLRAYAVLGFKKRASQQLGISTGTPYSYPWAEDEQFQRGLEIARRIQAELMEDHARERAVEGQRKYQFTKDGDPLRHPDLCDCGHHRKAHRDESGPERNHGECTGCECGGFKPAPYYEHAYSDHLLKFMLEANLPGRYGKKVQFTGMTAKLDLNALPDEALGRVIEGEHPLAVMAELAQGRLGPGEAEEEREGGASPASEG